MHHLFLTKRAEDVTRAIQAISNNAPRAPKENALGHAQVGSDDSRSSNESQSRSGSTVSIPEWRKERSETVFH